MDNKWCKRDNIHHLQKMGEWFIWDNKKCKMDNSRCKMDNKKCRLGQRL